MFELRARMAACAFSACLVTLLATAASAESLRQGAKLCLYPVQVPLPESAGEERRSLLERKLSAALIAASFGLADPEAVRVLEERVKQESGGFFDPATGERDLERHRAYRAQLARALRTELGCDAQLYALVVPVRATFNSGVATWDGVTQQVSSTGRIVVNILAGVQESGWVSAFSLWLRVKDLEGNDLAFRSAGIETPVQFAVLEDKDLVPDDLWLTDAAKLDAAIQSALGSQGEALRLQGTP